MSGLGTSQMRPTRVHSSSHDGYQLPTGLSDSAVLGARISRAGAAARRQRLSFSCCSFVALILLSFFCYLWIYEEASFLDNLSVGQGTYGFLPSLGGQKNSLKFQLQVKEGIEDLRVTLEQSMRNLGSESRSILKAMNDVKDDVDKRLGAFEKKLEEVKAAASDKSEEFVKIQTFVKELEARQDQLLARIEEEREALENLKFQLTRVKEDLTKEHVTLDEGMGDLAKYLVNLKEEMDKMKAVGLASGSALPSGPVSNQTAVVSHLSISDSSVSEFRDAVQHMTTSQQVEIQSLRAEVHDQLSKMVEHSASFANWVSQQTLNSTDTIPHMKHAQDPFLWSQHTFRAHAFHHFVQFSAYRKSAFSFAAVGLSVLEGKEARILGSCSWHSLGGSVEGKLRMIYPGEHHFLKYESAILICDLDSLALTGGYLLGRVNYEEFVMFREEPGSTDLEPSVPYKNLVTMCLAPIFGESFPLNLVRQFVEYHRMIGVDHFVFYDTGSLDGTLFESMFGEDLKSGAIDRTRFKDIDTMENWYHGQLLAIQDCLYRSRYSSRWTMFADFDEYFWPQPPNTLKYLLDIHEKSVGFSHGAYWFSVFKCRNESERLDVLRGTSKNATGGKGDSFEVEKFMMRWPHPACFLKDWDAYLCLADKGHRKVVVDPRKVEYLQIHGPQPDDTKFPLIEHLKADVAAHAHFQHLFGTDASQFCNETEYADSHDKWWKFDPSFARTVWNLRKSRTCDFSGDGCKRTL